MIDCHNIFSQGQKYTKGILCHPTNVLTDFHGIASMSLTTLMNVQSRKTVYFISYRGGIENYVSTSVQYLSVSCNTSN